MLALFPLITILLYFATPSHSTTPSVYPIPTPTPTPHLLTPPSTTPPYPINCSLYQSPSNWANLSSTSPWPASWSAYSSVCYINNVGDNARILRFCTSHEDHPEDVREWIHGNGQEGYYLDGSGCQIYAPVKVSGDADDTEMARRCLKEGTQFNGGVRSFFRCVERKEVKGGVEGRIVKGSAGWMVGLGWLAMGACVLLM